jgi:uncharacterized membrane protein
MVWLVLGVLLWSVTHLFPCAARAARNRLIERIGEGPYKGLFALTIVVSVVLMVIGWRSTPPSHVYAPPSWGRWATNLGMLIGLALFVASAVPTNLKRVLRHPQLTGVLVWGIAHLVSNGAQRSIILFGGLALWTVLAMASINRRDGAWQKPEPLPISAELKPVVGGLVLFAVIWLVHPWLAGVSPTPF